MGNGKLRHQVVIDTFAVIDGKIISHIAVFLLCTFAGNDVILILLNLCYTLISVSKFTKYLYIKDKLHIMLHQEDFKLAFAICAIALI